MKSHPTFTFLPIREKAVLQLSQIYNSRCTLINIPLMQRKTGLLPKWLFLSTIIRMMSVFVENRVRMPDSKASHWMFVYLSLGVACIRLLGVLKVNLVFYILLAMSYVLEICWLLSAWYSNCFSAFRVVCEVLIALFSLSWIVFLYPYYLLKKDEDSDKEK